MDNKLGKSYSLKSKTSIDGLFESGTRISSYPFVVFMKECKLEQKDTFKLVFSAPKKTFRFAHQRNRIKRVMRECVRLNKQPFETYLKEHNKQVAFFLIYANKEELEYELLQKKATKLFSKMIKQLDEK